jgi:hypothetical protein
MIHHHRGGDPVRRTFPSIFNMMNAMERSLRSCRGAGKSRFPTFGSHKAVKTETETGCKKLTCGQWPPTSGSSIRKNNKKSAYCQFPYGHKDASDELHRDRGVFSGCVSVSCVHTTPWNRSVFMVYSPRRAAAVTPKHSSALQGYSPRRAAAAAAPCRNLNPEDISLEWGRIAPWYLKNDCLLP